MYFEEGVNHGKRGDFRTCCYYICSIRSYDEDVNQGSGVVGGRLLNMLIFHWFISSMEQMLDHN